ncbi:MAG: sensor histidine kinase [Thiohalospira sp.]
MDKFLETIQYPDYILNDQTSDLSYSKLNETYHKITEQLKKSWLEKEKKQQYFKYTLDNIPVGVLAFDLDGNIEFCNQTAKNIFNVNQLNHISNLKKAGEELLKIEPMQSMLLEIESHLEKLKILAQSVQIKQDNKTINIITLQNIKTQLEESELEAWQKLIRVLTHEIMNSVTPIKSLTYSLQKKLNLDEGFGNDKEPFLKGLNAIEARSRGLLNFVESYKNLTQIPHPAYERVYIHQLFDNVTALLINELKEKGIKIQKQLIADDISIIADEKLIVQVLINLIRNAVKALNGKEALPAGRHEKTIELKADYYKEKNVMIQVKDNGSGIPAELLDKIFIPFFSTTEGGSGIGLSFSRQVMILHNGRITVNSSPGSGSIFSLYF